MTESQMNEAFDKGTYWSQFEHYDWDQSVYWFTIYQQSASYLIANNCQF